MITEDEFRKKLYVYIRNRTEQIKYGSQMPYVSWKSSQNFGRRQGFDSKPVLVAIKVLEQKGAILSKWSNDRGQYEYVARI